MYLYPYKNLKLSRTDASKRLTPAPLNKISLTLSHKSVLSVTTVTISVLSLTSTPLSAVAQPVEGSRRPSSAVLRISCVSWYIAAAVRHPHQLLLSNSMHAPIRRQAERRWLKSKLTVHKQIYDSIKQKLTTTTTTKRSQTSLLLCQNSV